MLNKTKCKVEIKKVLAKTLFSLGALASIVAFQTKKQVDYSKASFEPFVIEKKNANGSYANFVDDFDISGDLPVAYLTSMAGSTNETFGTVSYVCNSYGVSKRVIYKSHWVESQEPTYEAYNDRIFKTYKFEHYLSLPVNEVKSYELQPHSSNTFTMSAIYSTSETVRQMVSRSYTISDSVSNTIGLKIGGSISYDGIKLNGSASTSTTITVSESLNTTIATERSKTITYSEQATSNWTLVNDTDNYRVFAFHYRQRFALYFTTVYKMEYTRTRTGVIFLGLDDSFSYTFKEYTPEKTVYFMIPIDAHVPFCYDEYYYDENGNEVIDRPFANNTVYF